jgi:hypothetical protein
LGVKIGNLVYPGQHTEQSAYLNLGADFEHPSSGKNDEANVLSRVNGVGIPAWSDCQIQPIPIVTLKKRCFVGLQRESAGRMFPHYQERRTYSGGSPT